MGITQSSSLLPILLLLQTTWEKIVNDLTSLHFLVSVIFVGIFCSLAATYLKNPVDNFFSTISSRWRRRSQQRQVNRIKRIAQLKGNINKQFELASEISGLRFESIMLVFAGLAFLILAIAVRIIETLQSSDFLFTTFKFLSAAMCLILLAGGVFLALKSEDKAMILRDTLRANASESDNDANDAVVP